MHSILNLYRNLLNNLYIPKILKRIIQRIGIFFYNKIFANRHYRLEPYNIRLNKDVSFKMMLDWMDYTHSNYIFYKSYEEKNSNFILKNIKDNDCFIDLGANVGYFSLVVSKFKPSSRVFAIEAVSKNIYVLEKNIKENNLKNIKPFHLAIGKEDGKQIDISYRFLNSGSGSIVGFLGNNDLVVNEYVFNEKVKISNLDTFFSENNISKCKILKMDIQGAEADAIIGAENVLKNKKIDYLIIEHNPGKYGEEVRNLLEKFNYHVFDIKKDGSLEKLSKDQELVEKVDYVYSHLNN